MRATLDSRNETLNYRIRDAETMKVPYMAVVGKREAEAGTAAVRKRGAGNKQVVVERTELVNRLRREIETRSLD